ncbi:ester cyclase [Cryptosporangium aurantiacum]|uniref:SnoaL-like polyketide cyclase n=1 Tax=Cryptosporangium aurantiacum TaxID=134849 RepID=A0A1M7QS41_9ACTN|nr:ester cyclase [Cryptosporangium aurantiacum]SHN34567.1 SnoaL-like polyketide cyclase [Cryptosporangium aurantiacum]
MDLASRFATVNAAWTGQDWDAWRATCAPGYTFRPLPGWELDVPQTLAWSRAVFAAYPDYRETVHHLHVTDDTVVAEVAGTATHTGPFELPGQPALPPTGRTLRHEYAKVLVFDDAGLVTHDRQYLDLSAFLG